MSEIKGYVISLKYGEPEDKFIRGISVDGGKAIMKDLKNDPPQFINVKGRMVAVKDISQVMPIYR